MLSFGAIPALQYCPVTLVLRVFPRLYHGKSQTEGRRTSVLLSCQASLPYLALAHLGLPHCFLSEMMKLLGLGNFLKK